MLWTCVLGVYCANGTPCSSITNSPQRNVFLSSAVSPLMATVEAVKIILIIAIIIAATYWPSVTLYWVAKSFMRIAFFILHNHPFAVASHFVDTWMWLPCVRGLCLQKHPILFSPVSSKCVRWFESWVGFFGHHPEDREETRDGRAHCAAHSSIWTDVLLPRLKELATTAGFYVCTFMLL